LHRFRQSDGAFPKANLVMDKSGALYGTTFDGGSTTCATGPQLGCGTVFKLSPPAPGETTWNIQNYKFKWGGDFGPTGGLLFRKGVLYGATFRAASFGSIDEPHFTDEGGIFSLKPPAPGETTWKHKVLFAFDITGGLPYPGGIDPRGYLVADADGALYGNTFRGGGKHGFGVVFKLTPPGPGHPTWSETVLHVFDDFRGGVYPQGKLTFDSLGNLYGATQTGGPPQKPYGTVFKVTP
jgi:uncharacterized repeat protein (TIGR03803 family)